MGIKSKTGVDFVVITFHLLKISHNINLNIEMEFNDLL